MYVKATACGQVEGPLTWMATPQPGGNAERRLRVMSSSGFFWGSVR